MEASKKLNQVRSVVCPRCRSDFEGRIGDICSDCGAALLEALTGECVTCGAETDDAGDKECSACDAYSRHVDNQVDAAKDGGF